MGCPDSKRNGGHTHDTSVSSEAPEYKLLSGHYRTDGTFKTGEQLRMEYIHLTDELIHKMTHGVDMIDPVTHEYSRQIPDTIVFLDKSARPLAWLTRELWDRLAIRDDGSIAPMPEMKFLNIDRNQWINKLDPEGNGALDVHHLDDSIIRSLRSVFIPPSRKREGLTEQIDNELSGLDNKNILVVDEVYATGNTILIAQKLLACAFPTSRIAGTHWMSGIVQKGLARGNKDLPVWYKKEDPRGRGVNDRMKSPSGTVSENLTQRLGAWFLSTRFEKPDPESLLLRKELHSLANDPDVPVRISFSRYDLDIDEEAYDKHVSRVNNSMPAIAVQDTINTINRKNSSRR